jgi:transposase
MGSGREGGGGASAVWPLADVELRIYLCQDPVDFRAGINGLSTLVEATLKYDPFSRNLFCFTNKRKNQIKVLYWQRSGFCLWQKRLEEERFKWPTHLRPLADGRPSRPAVVTLSDEQFRWLLDGLDLKHLKPHRALEYRTVL